MSFFKSSLAKSAVLILVLVISAAWAAENKKICTDMIPVPRLERPPVIDGNLSEWKYQAFSDGVWDIYRIQQSHWFDPKINRLTLHGDETSLPEDDLNARYYIA
ncbi:MAG TPA: hypothetical protein VIJ25_16810, partial [Methylococcales bacterium]